MNVSQYERFEINRNVLLLSQTLVIISRWSCPLEYVVYRLRYSKLINKLIVLLITFAR